MGNSITKVKIGVVTAEFWRDGVTYCASGSPEEIIRAGVARPSHRRSGIAGGYFNHYSGQSCVVKKAESVIRRDHGFQDAMRAVLDNRSCAGFALPAVKPRRARRAAMLAEQDNIIIAGLTSLTSVRLNRAEASAAYWGLGQEERNRIFKEGRRLRGLIDDDGEKEGA